MIGSPMAQATNSFSPRRTRTNNIDNNSTRKGASEFAQLLIGGANEFRQQGECFVGVVAKCVGKRFFVEDANLGRNLLKRFVLFHLSA